MQGANVVYLVVAYAVVWVALLAYLGWIALRMRGVQTDLEAVRELVEEREAHSDGRE
jgi:hypothetical protein